jgi:hypothetical protein
MKTYLTSTELEYYFSNASEYGAEQVEFALIQSYKEVNSYIKPGIVIPSKSY